MDEALEPAAASPMNEIGTTGLFVGDVFFGELNVPAGFADPTGDRAGWDRVAATLHDAVERLGGR